MLFFNLFVLTPRVFAETKLNLTHGVKKNRKQLSKKKNIANPIFTAIFRRLDLNLFLGTSAFSMTWIGPAIGGKLHFEIPLR